MSSKSKKSSVTPVPSATSSGTEKPPTPTPATGASSNSNNRRSASSPTWRSRLAEKTELQHLNDRLACYIDRARYLEQENARLTVEIQTSSETVTRETSNIKQMFEAELSDARKMLDETAKEKARLEIDTKRMWEENVDLKQRLDKKSKDLDNAENSARLYENRFSELSNKYNSANADLKKVSDEAKDLKKENDKLRKQFNELRNHLEEETLARVDLENTLQSLREELTFKDQLHMQELTETRSKRQVDISEIDGRLSEQYEAKLHQSLQELRDQYEQQMRDNREKIEQLYDAKMKNLQSASERNSSAASSALEELRLLRLRNDSRLTELESINSSLNGRIRELEEQLEITRNRHAVDQAELLRLREEIANQLQEYQDLMDLKVSMDLEISTYDKLLTGEEMRLNIPKPGRQTPSGRMTPSRAGGKRKRNVFDESEDRSLNDYSINSSAKGEIKIIEMDADGKFVKLQNVSNKEISIGGWQLIRKAGPNETAFRFHRSVKVDGHAIITVWSSDIGVTHEPPLNIVMKQQKWFVNDTMKTSLMNLDGEEVAVAERIKRQLSTHASRHREEEQDVRRSPASTSVGRLFSFW